MRRGRGEKAEQRARRHYRLRGYLVLAENVWSAGYELDLVVRRGRRLVFGEVKGKGGARYGHPAEMVGPEKQRRLRRAAEGWLARHPRLRDLDISFEVAAVRKGKVERIRNAF